MTMTATEHRYHAALAAVQAIVEQYDGCVPAAHVPELRRLKDRMCDAHDAMQAEIEAAFAAAVEHLSLDESSGRITVSRSVRGGGRRHWSMPGDADYAALLARVRAEQSIDARVAEVAYGVWAPWRGPVRIDYYGDSSARVSRGAGKAVMVDLAISYTAPKGQE
jgi:hypothetical protein